MDMSEAGGGYQYPDSADEECFERWWAGLPDGWPVTEPWKRVAREAWSAALAGDGCDDAAGSEVAQVRRPPEG